MSPKPLPGVTRVTKPCQGRPAPCSLPRNASVRPAGTTGSERWLLRNKIGLALIVSGAVLCFANPGFFFGFIIWVGIILYFQKQGDDGTGVGSRNSGDQFDDYDPSQGMSSSWITHTWHNPTLEIHRNIHGR